MIIENKKQLKIYIILVLILAVFAALSVLFTDSLLQSVGQLPTEIPTSLLALANFGMMLIGYGLFGLLGYYIAKKLNWPGIYNERERWKKLVFRPLYFGLVLGLFLIIAQKFFISLHGLGEFPHPGFPLSIFASITAGIGEELIFRLFLVSFWAFILGFIFKKFGKQKIINWIAIIIASLAFGIGHFPSLYFFYGFVSVNQIPAAFIIEVLLLNGLIGVVAGREFIKYGFVAAVGIHFWTDIVWHVIYGFFS